MVQKILHIYLLYNGCAKSPTFFPLIGIFNENPNEFATAAPTLTPVNDPGPKFTEISVISVTRSPCFFNNLSIKTSTTWDFKAVGFELR